MNTKANKAAGFPGVAATKANVPTKPKTLTVRLVKHRAADEQPVTVELTPDAQRWLKALRQELGIDAISIVSLALRDYALKLNVLP